MKRVEFWETKIADKVVYEIDDLLNLIIGGKSFTVKDEYLPGDEPANLIEESNSDINLVYTDESHPVVVVDNLLIESMINSKFYQKHEKAILEAEKKRRLSSEYQKISKEEHTIEFLKEVLESNAKDITLDGFLPSEEELDLIYESKKNVTSIYNGQYKKHGINAVIGNYSLSDLEKGIINIDFDLSKREIENLKYIGEDVKVNFKVDTDKDYDANMATINRINTVIEEFQKLNKNNEVSIGINDLKDRECLINNLHYNVKNYSNFNIYYSIQPSFPFSKLVLIDDKLKELTNDVKGKDLSDMEKYLILYNKVKRYKKYKETDGDKLESRELNHILFNDYIVCVGFSLLLKEVLRLENIESTDYNTVVDTSYDNGYTEEEITLTSEQHRRLLVNIKDDKYEVDNYFIADPTWDNNMKYDVYSYALEPMSSMREDKRLFQFMDIDAFLDVDDFEDYNNKLNHIIKRKMEKYDSTNEVECVLMAYSEVADLIMNTLKELDHKLYDFMLDKYRLASKIKTMDNYENFFTKAGRNIVKKTNKSLSPTTFKKLLYNVKKSQIKDFKVEDLNKLLEVKAISDEESYPNRGR